MRERTTMPATKVKRALLQGPYARTSLYYVALWGAMALTSSFMSIDLNNRGVTELQWGFISAARSLVIFLATPLITRLADRRNQRVKVLTIILILNAFAMLLYMLPENFTGFLLVSLVVSIVSAGLMPIGDGVIVRMAKRYDLEFGRIRMWGSIGFAVFGILGGILWAKIGYSMLYWVGFCANLLVALLSVQLEEPQIEEPVQGSPSSMGGLSLDGKAFGVVLKDWLLLLFLVAALLRSASELMFQSFSALYINEITQSAFFVGLLRGGAAILEIFVMLFLQKLIHRFGLERVLLSGFIVQALGIGVFTFNTNPWVMYLGTSLRSVGFALYFIAAVQFVDRRAGPEDAATYQGLLAVVGRGLAPLLFTPLAGWVYQQWSGKTVFIIAMMACIGAAVVFLPVVARTGQAKSVGEGNSG